MYAEIKRYLTSVLGADFAAPEHYELINMGQVQLRYKVMLDSGSEEEIDSNNVANALRRIETGDVQRVESKPLAFGMVYLEVIAIIEDAEGEVDRFEDALRGVHGVGQLEVLEMGRLL